MMADAPGYEFDNEDNDGNESNKPYKPKTKDDLKRAFLKKFGK